MNIKQTKFILYVILGVGIALSLSLLFPAPAQAQTINWTQQNPVLPQTLLWDISCASTTHCIVVGNGGTTFATTDGGISWTVQTSGTTQNLRGVDCFSNTDCVSTGFSQRANNTSNGGATWNSQTVGPGGSNNGVDCVFNGTNIYCVGAGNNGDMMYTANGGTSWTQFTIASLATGGGEQFREISCVFDTTVKCLAVGVLGKIAHTADGGVSWTVRAATPQTPATLALRGISCDRTMTPTKCTAVGDGGVILFTTDWGVSWTAQTSGITTNLLGVSCVSTTDCVAVGPIGTILSTTDGGTTWNSQFSGTTNDLNEVDCASANDCIAAGNNSTIVKTTDGGTTWTRPLFWDQLFEVFCTSANDCIAVGANGTIATTNDGGVNWMAQSSGTLDDFRSLDCTSAANCIAVGDNGTIRLTANGGTTWISPTTTATTNLVVAVSCLTTNDCIATANGSTLVKTIDGGANWTAIAPSSVNLGGIDCPSATNCIAVGLNGTISVTVDAGVSWSAPTSGTAVRLNEVDCFSVNDCIAVGQSGVVVTTNDGGLTWSTPPPPTASELWEISCTSATECITVGNNGEIWVTVDGGVSWTASTSGTTNALRGIDCFTSGDCVIVGDVGVIFTSVVPEIEVLGNGTLIADGSITPNVGDDTEFGNVLVGASLVHIFTINNTGAAPLTLNLPITGTVDFAPSTPTLTIIPTNSVATFQVTFTPPATGLFTATIEISNDDLDEPVYDFVVQGTGISPEIGVSGNGTSIADGSAAPNVGDDTEFGNVVVGSPVAHTFTIVNTGTAALNLTTPFVVAGSADFTVSPPAATTIPPNGSTTFQVTYNPTPATLGLNNATIQITNDDLNENPYDFAVQGTGVTPEIEVFGNSTLIPDGSTGPPTVADDTYFGNSVLVGTSVVHTFVITNTGGSTLTLNTPIVVSGSSDFTASAPASTSVPPNNSTTFQVTFSPSTPSAAGATIQIGNDDLNENPYDFVVGGNGISPEIEVQGNGPVILDDSTTPSGSDDTDFGSMIVGAAPIVRTYTIFNLGNATLNLTSPINIIGANASDFTATVANVVLPVGISTTLQVVFNPSGAGLRSATIQIGNDDLDENPYDFAIQGTAIAPTPTFTPFPTPTLTPTPTPTPIAFVSMSPLAQAIPEGGTATVNILLGNAIGVPVDVTLGTLVEPPDYAISSLDYTAINQTLTFQPGETSKSITVFTNQDSLLEPDERFRIVVDAISLGNVQTGNFGNALITIIDDDAFTPTPTSSVTPTPTLTPTPTSSNTPTNTPLNTATATPTLIDSLTPTLFPPTFMSTMTPTAIDTSTVTPLPSATPTATPTPIDTPSPTSTPTVTVIPTATPTDTSTATDTPTMTLSPTSSSTPTITPMPSPTPTSSSTSTPSPTLTLSPTPSPSLSPTFTNSPTAISTLTPTIIPTETEPPTPTMTDTPTMTPTPMATPTPTMSPNLTPEPNQSTDVTVGIVEISADNSRILPDGRIEVTGNLSLGDFLTLGGDNAVIRYDDNSIEAVGRLILNGPNPLVLAEGLFNVDIQDGILTMTDESQILLDEIAGIPVASIPLLSQYDILRGIALGRTTLRFQAQGVDTLVQLDNFEIAPGPLFSGRFETFTLEQEEANIIVPDGAILDNNGLFAPTVLLEVANGAFAIGNNFRFGREGFIFNSTEGMVEIRADSYQLLSDGQIEVRGGLGLGEHFGIAGDDAVIRYDNNLLEATGTLVLNGDIPLILAQGTFQVDINTARLTMTEESEILLTELAGFPFTLPPTLNYYNLLQGTIHGQGTLQLRSQDVDVQATLDYFEIDPGPVFRGSFQGFSFEQHGTEWVVPAGATLDEGGFSVPIAFVEVASQTIATCYNFHFNPAGFACDRQWTPAVAGQETTNAVEISADNYRELDDGRTEAVGSLSLGQFFGVEGEEAALRYDSNTMEAVGQLVLKGATPLPLAEGTFNVDLNAGILSMTDESQMLLEEIAGLPVASMPTLLQYDLNRGIVKGQATLHLQAQNVNTHVPLNRFEIAPGPLFSGHSDAFTLELADIQIIVPDGAILDNNGLFAATVFVDVADGVIDTRHNFRLGRDGFSFDGPDGMVQVRADRYNTLPDGQIEATGSLGLGDFFSIVSDGATIRYDQDSIQATGTLALNGSFPLYLARGSFNIDPNTAHLSLSEETEILLTDLAGFPFASPPTFNRYNLLRGTIEGEGNLRLRTQDVDIQAALSHFELAAGPSIHGHFEPFTFELAGFPILVPTGSTLDNDGLWADSVFLEVSEGVLAALDDFRLNQDGITFAGEPGSTVVTATVRRFTSSISSDRIVIERTDIPEPQKVFLPLISR